MKYMRVYEIRADNRAEENFLRSKFPKSIWVICENHTKFFLQDTDKPKVLNAIKEWKELQALKQSNKKEK